MANIAYARVPIDQMQGGANSVKKFKYVKKNDKLTCSGLGCIMLDFKTLSEFNPDIDKIMHHAHKALEEGESPGKVFEKLENNRAIYGLSLVIEYWKWYIKLAPGEVKEKATIYILSHYLNNANTKEEPLICATQYLVKAGWETDFILSLMAEKDEPGFEDFRNEMIYAVMLGSPCKY